MSGCGVGDDDADGVPSEFGNVVSNHMIDGSDKLHTPIGELGDHDVSVLVLDSKDKLLLGVCGCDVGKVPVDGVREDRGVARVERVLLVELYLNKFRLFLSGDHWDRRYDSFCLEVRTVASDKQLSA